MEISVPQRSSLSQPWDRPFWKPVHGKEGVFAYLVIIHVLSLLGLILYPLPSLKVLGLTLLFTALGGLGTTVCYHRLLAHKTLKTNPVVEQFLIFWAVFNGSGHPASWVAYHRLHHAVTDLPEDISSPKQGGFWWAHLRWLYQTEPADKKKWAPELTAGVYRIWGWAETPVIVLSIAPAGVLAPSPVPGEQPDTPRRGQRGRRFQHQHLVARPVSADRLGRKLAQEPPYARGFGAAGAALVSDRHRLVCHLDAGGRGAGAFGQAATSFLGGAASARATFA